MVKYIAKYDLGDYLKGSELPEEVAKMYIKMYDVSPIAIVDGEATQPKDIKTTSKKETSKRNPLDVDGDGDVDFDDVKKVVRGAFSRKKRGKK